jgi:hypothetical protein
MLSDAAKTAKPLVYIPHVKSGDVWAIDPATFSVVGKYRLGGPRSRRFRWSWPSSRHPDVLAAQRRERARIRSERHQRRARPRAA